MKTLAQWLLPLLLCSCEATGELASNSAVSDESASDLISDSEAVSEALKSEPVNVLTTSPGCEWEAGLLAWRQPGFRQTYTAVNFNTLVVHDAVESSAGEWEPVSHRGNTNFILMDVASAGLDDYVLLGFTRDGDIVIERWVLGLGGGAVVERGRGAALPSPSLAPKEFIKTNLFQGLPEHKPLVIEADPSGRFVIFALRDPGGITTVYQLDCSIPGKSPVALTDSAKIPELGSITSVGKFDHVALGRTYSFDTEAPRPGRVVFIDGNDDAIFDGSPLVGDEAYFRTLGPWQDWRSLWW